MGESILRVLSVAGRNNLRCLNHARVIISSGSWHHSETATSAGSVQRERTVFHPLEVAGNRHPREMIIAGARCVSRQNSAYRRLRPNHMRRSRKAPRAPLS